MTAIDIKRDSETKGDWTVSETRPKVGSLKQPDNTEAKTDKDKAEVLNRFFSSVFTSETVDIPEVEVKHLGPGLQDLEITEEKVLKKLTELNPNKSAGPDNLHPRLLRELAYDLAHPLTMIFSNPWNQAGYLKHGNKPTLHPFTRKGERHSWKLQTGYSHFGSRKTDGIHH
ncbi:hypothetical protein Bbelb_350800 [Branchiostoma belcheri]|nr:hypothetical protein Bbelb_350800 [Branchiostoma belcheri]